MNRTNLSQLAVLATVAQCASFRGAARELGIAPSAVSHAVSSLEARLGVRLLARSTRSVAPTEEGAQLLERLRPALSEIDLALETAVEARDRPAGNLRLTVPRTAAHLTLTPRLGAFAVAYPDIVLEIVIEDRFTDVVEGGFDAGVRLGESLQRDMIAVRIGPDLRGAVVGAPSYFATSPKPSHPRELADHRCIRFRFSSGILYRWEFEKDGEEIEIAAQGPLILDEDHLIAQAAVGGAGLAFVFEDYVRTPLATGRLIRVLDDWCPSFDGFFVYYPSRRQMRPALRAFVHFFKVSG
ncbi:MAG: LysR family transcriptional regulator [Mesorhizobium sp.]|nr:MAG: LysR family transcriptional regulator [Mesorhizobium sp.]